MEDRWEGRKKLNSVSAIEAEPIEKIVLIVVLDIRHGSATTLNKDISNLLINPLKFMSVLYNIEISEFFEVCKIIEVELAKKAAIRATEENMDMMRQCLNKAEDNIDNPDIFLYSEKHFHECIFAASRNRILAAIINSLNTLLIDSRRESVKPFVDLWKSFNQHLAVFKAIEKREPESAGQAMLVHLENVERRLYTVDSDY
jgi:GntR family transcriptional repressor for pyruvate dehydrogenase complex